MEVTMVVISYLLGLQHHSTSQAMTMVKYFELLATSQGGSPHHVVWWSM